MIIIPPSGSSVALPIENVGFRIELPRGAEKHHIIREAVVVTIYRQAVRLVARHTKKHLPSQLPVMVNIQVDRANKYRANMFATLVIANMSNASIKSLTSKSQVSQKVFVAALFEEWKTRPHEHNS
jgi:hypothetical protein